jgi:hypothetical protein
MVKRGKTAKSALSGDAGALEGAGEKRRRDGAASASAAKAAELSGDDRFSLSKFQLDERFKSRRASVVEAAVVERDDDEEEKVEEEEEEEEFESGSGDDDADDGNYNIDDDDSLEDGGDIMDSAENPDGAGASAKSKKLAKKLKPMSPEELAAFMKVAVLCRASSHPCVTLFCAGARATRCRVSQPHSALHEAHQSALCSPAPSPSLFCLICISRSGPSPASKVRGDRPHLPHARGRRRHEAPQKNGRQQADQVRGWMGGVHGQEEGAAGGGHVKRAAHRQQEPRVLRARPVDHQVSAPRAQAWGAVR